MKWLKRILGALVVFTVVAVLAGATHQRWAEGRDERAFPIPGRLVDIGGRSLHLYCSGAGPVTVVLENGLTANYPTWSLVQAPLAATTRVCSYDRAGMGWSEPSPHPTSAEFVSRDLAALLAAAHVEGPYVLVGWSAGGVFVRRFQREHPADVVAMVFVDSSHEGQKKHLPRPPGDADFERQMHDQLRLCDALAWTGAVRLSGAMAEIDATLALPADVRRRRLGLANRTGYCRGVLKEIDGFQGDIVAPAGPAPLGDLPIVVLTRGRPSRAADFAPAVVPESFLQENDRVWAALQDELAALSTRSVHRTVAESGHPIPLEAPAAVVDAVREALQMSARARAPTPSLEASGVPSPSP